MDEPAVPPPGFAPLDPSSPFGELIGPLFVRGEGPDAVLGLAAQEHHTNAGGSVHGGLLASLCDTAFGRAVRAQSDTDPSVATVSLTTDYLAPAEPGSWLEARTKVEKLGGRLAFADCSVTAAGREVVRSRAVFAVLD